LRHVHFKVVHDRPPG